MNRIGNLIVPNDNYCKFEDWLTPILDAMLAEQKATGKVWAPSSFIRRLGKEINNEESIYYWAYKVRISLFFFTSVLTNYPVLERHPGILPSSDRWLYWRYDIFPLLQKPRPHRGYRSRYSRSE